MRKNDSGDQAMIEMGEARVLFTTWQVTKQKVMTPERIKYLEKRIGPGSSERIKRLMQKLRDGEIE
jgi:hypothetical protein